MTAPDNKDHRSRIAALKSRRGQVEASGFKAKDADEGDTAHGGILDGSDGIASGPAKADGTGDKAARLLKFLAERRGNGGTESGDADRRRDFIKKLIEARKGGEGANGGGGRLGAALAEGKLGGGKLGGGKLAGGKLGGEGGRELIKRLMEARQSKPSGDEGGSDGRREKLKLLLERLGKGGGRS